jgi:hypothetical protein
MSRSGSKVIIFGWFGAKEAHLKKYVSLYRNLGFENVVVRQTPILKSITYSGWEALRVSARKDREELAKGADVVHLFSGGIFPYHNMRNVVPEFKTKALVYDSGPFIPCEKLTARYIRNSGVVPAFIANNIPLEKMILSLWRADGFNHDVQMNEQKRFLDTLSCPAPKLFLHGEKDKIICPDIAEMVHNHIRTSPTAGPFTLKTWNTSHTLHYRDEPEAYTTALTEFVEKHVKFEPQSSSKVEEVIESSEEKLAVA